MACNCSDVASLVKNGEALSSDLAPFSSYWLVSAIFCAVFALIVFVFACCVRRRKSLRLLNAVGEEENEPLLLEEDDDEEEEEDDDEDEGDLGVVFEDVSYVVKGGLRVLRGVSGRVAPGEMVAVIGASGAGKSSLLRIVAGRTRNDSGLGVVGGRVWLASARGAAETRVRSTPLAFVAQQDVLLPTATLREALSDAARLHVRARSPLVLARRVRRVLAALRLEKAAETRAADASGGERRRASLGMALLARPRVLVCDEPLTGLDSASAAIVLRVLRDECAQRRRMAVLLSVHQPTRAAFAGFDRVLLLTRRGDCAYFGAPRHARLLVRRALDASDDGGDGGHNESDERNDADDASNVAQQQQEEEEEHGHVAEQLIDAAAHEDDAVLRRMVRAGAALCATHAAAAPADAPPPLLPTTARVARQPSELTRCFVLFRRALRHLARERRLLVLQWTLSAAVGLFIGVAFLHLGSDLPGTQNRTGMLFFSILFYALAALSSMPSLVAQRALMVHERAAGAYSTAAFYVAALAADVVPLRVAPPLLYAALVYPLVGLNTASASRVVVFVGTLVLTNVVAAAACMAVAAASRRASTATLLCTLGFIYALLFGGYLLNGSTLRWIQYASFIQYAFALLMTNEFTGRTLRFDPRFDGHVIVDVPIAGAEWVVNFGIELGAQTRNFAALGAFALFFFAFGYVLLRMAR